MHPLPVIRVGLEGGAVAPCTVSPTAAPMQVDRPACRPEFRCMRPSSPLRHCLTGAGRQSEAVEELRRGRPGDRWPYPCRKGGMGEMHGDLDHCPVL